MDMKEFYNAVGGDYTDVCERFMNEKIVGVFIEKFLQDSTFAEMADMLEHDNLPEAFRTAHTGFVPFQILLIREHGQHIFGRCENTADDGFTQRDFGGDVAVEQLVRHVALVIQIADRRG